MKTKWTEPPLELSDELNRLKAEQAALRELMGFLDMASDERLAELCAAISKLRAQTEREWHGYP
jgi:hypothetical protein